VLAGLRRRRLPVALLNDRVPRTERIPHGPVGAPSALSQPVLLLKPGNKARVLL
jgi:hypothetical protein